METFNEPRYTEHFEHLTGRQPFAYQIEVARLRFERRHVVLRAPTGAGKTLAVLAPFLFPAWNQRPTRLIYALPLRTLAQGVYSAAREVASKLGNPLEAAFDENG